MLAVNGIAVDHGKAASERRQSCHARGALITCIYSIFPLRLNR
jgi:hypothetical protein